MATNEDPLRSALLAVNFQTLVVGGETIIGTSWANLDIYQAKPEFALPGRPCFASAPGQSLSQLRPLLRRGDSFGTKPLPS